MSDNHNNSVPSDYVDQEGDVNYHKASPPKRWELPGDQAGMLWHVTDDIRNAVRMKDVTPEQIAEAVLEGLKEYPDDKVNVARHIGNCVPEAQRRY